jgi:hypothetical protein
MAGNISFSDVCKDQVNLGQKDQSFWATYLSVTLKEFNTHLHGVRDAAQCNYRYAVPLVVWRNQPLLVTGPQICLRSVLSYAQCQVLEPQRLWRTLCTPVPSVSTLTEKTVVRFGSQESRLCRSGFYLWRFIRVINVEDLWSCL